MATYPAFFMSSIYPTSDIRLVVQACRPGDALEPDDPRYFDLAQLRQGSSVVAELAGALEQQLEPGHFHRGLLSGHRGSGKSTELFQLKAWANAHDWVCLWVEVDTYLDNTQLEFSDLFLLAAQSVVRQMEELKMPLPPEKLKRVEEWFAEITKQDMETVKSEIALSTTAEAGGGLPFLGKLIANFTAGVKANSDHQLEVRRTFRQEPLQLITYVNDLLKTANQQLQASSDADLRRANGLLLVFDNLDRYEVKAIEDLLTQGATLMRHLQCHTIYTIPVELRCRTKNVYWDEFEPSVILPMPALRRREDLWDATVETSPFDESAVDSMVDLLKKRLDVEALFERPADVRLLAKMSGGCVRDLMHLVTAARKKSVVSLSDPPLQQITASGVTRAIQEVRANRVEGVLEGHYERLVKIAGRKPEAQQMDEAALVFLSQRRILQYGDETGHWIDVHPLLVETEGFRRVHAAQEATNA